MKKKRISIKKQSKKHEKRYAVFHKTRGFVGFVKAYNIAVVRVKFPAEEGYSIYRRR